MNLSEETRGKLLYHARMTALALLAGLALFLALIGAFVVLAWLGVVHPEDR
jgi:predicted small integral membrane protein